MASAVCVTVEILAFGFPAGVDSTGSENEEVHDADQHLGHDTIRQFEEAGIDHGCSVTEAGKKAV